MSWPSRLVRIFTLPCDAASELSSRELEGPLPGLDRVAYWGHLMACGSCRRFRRQIRFLRAALRGRDRRPIDAGWGGENDTLSPEARLRIARAVAESLRDGAQGPGIGPE